MNIESAKSLHYGVLQSNYKTYLSGQDFAKSTVNTMATDAFYLWNHGGPDLFWNVLGSDTFEEDAKSSLTKALQDNSSGQVDQLINGYLSPLRHFRDYILSADAAEAEQHEDLQVLKDFLLDINCLDPLSEWSNKFNIFDILKITRVEIRHSNMLAWLLDPNENHGLGDSIIRGFIQYLVPFAFDEEDAFSFLLMDCYGFEILREWHHIDLIAVSDDEKFVLCIENKIDSHEHDNQLVRYKELVDRNFPDYNKAFVFLSPDGSEASEPDSWCSMGYQDIITIIEAARGRNKLHPEAELLINNYIDTVRRDIVGDEKLAQICAEIYSKHQKAIDLIIENKPDRASDLAEILRAWASEKTQKGELEILSEKCNKRNTYFTTKTMSEILPDLDEPVSGWNTNNIYIYDIINLDGNEFYMQFIVSSKNISDEQRQRCDEVNEILPAKHQKQNWQWRTHYSDKHVKTDDELSEEKIFAQLDKKFKDLRTRENELKEKICGHSE